MKTQPLLAERIQFLGDRRDRRTLVFAAIRERERVEAKGFGVDWIVTVAKPGAGCQSPSDVGATGQHTQAKPVFDREDDEFVVG